MKLYYSPGSCGLASQIALREAGIDFDLVAVDFKTKTTTEGDYLQVAPKGFVPALLLDDGDLITESAVILQWIADRVPDRRLLPAAGSRERYRALEWLNVVATDLHRGMAVMFSAFIEESSKRAFAKGYLAGRFDYVDDHLFGNDHVLGERVSVVDFYLYNILSWPDRVGIDLSGHASIGRFMARMDARPSVRAARAAEGLPPR